MDEEENELVVTDGVPETSEENVSEVETNTSEGVNETQESTDTVQNSEEIEKQIEERVNQQLEEKMESRLIRERVKQEKEFNTRIEKYKQLEQILSTGLGTNNIDDTISKMSDFYKEQGVTIPTQIVKSNLTERQEQILAKAEVEEIRKCGTKEMESEANRIAKIPFEKRTYQEKIILNALAEELISQRNIKDLQAKGYDAKVLNSDDFRNFKAKFSNKEPITEIYEMYSKINNIGKEIPKSPGSAKTTASNNSVKEFYTKEEVSRMTEDELDNPALMKAVEYSMTQWGKNSK